MSQRLAYIVETLDGRSEHMGVLGQKDDLNRDAQGQNIGCKSVRI